MIISIRKKYIAIVFATASIISACDKSAVIDNGEDASTDVAITFNNTFTRASENTTNLQDSYKQFVVGASKVNSDSNRKTVMKNYTVSFDGTGWGYEDVTNNQSLKFWDLSATNYKFNALAPIPNSTQYEFGDDGELTIHQVSTDADWFVAITQRDMTGMKDWDVLNSTEVLIQDITSKTATVPLRFHHLLAQVEFRIYDPNGMYFINPLKVELTDVYKQAKFMTTGWDYTGFTTTTETVYNNPISVNALTKEDAITLATLNVIPQSFSGTANLHVVMNGETDESKNFNEPLNGSWESGKHYIYYLKVSGKMEVILVGVVVEAWTEDTAIDAGEQTNW